MAGLVGEGDVLEGNGSDRRGLGLVRGSPTAMRRQFGCGEDLMAEVQHRAPGFERGGERTNVHEDLREA